jgi:hypothetical protein
MQTPIWTPGNTDFADGRRRRDRTTQGPDNGETPGNVETGQSRDRTTQGPDSGETEGRKVAKQGLARGRLALINVGAPIKHRERRRQ